MSTKAQLFAHKLRETHGPALAVINEQEIGWRKTRDGKMVWLFDFDTAPGDPEERLLFETCPDCGGGMVIKTGKYGSFWGCPEYPKCRGTKPLR